MQTGLLAVDLAVPIGICAGVLALAALLYGIFRKFTRVSWLSWQVLIVFAATLLAGVLPTPASQWGGFALAAGKKILPVTTFGCAAYNGKGKKILCLCDALHAHYYACGYNEAGEVTLPPSYIPEEELRALAAQGYELRTLENTDFLPADLPCVRIDPAKALAAEAEKLAENEEDFKEPAALYIRKCQAEIEKDERAAKQLADGDAGAEK